jgi:Protein of unknown function (DUF2000)
MYADNETKFTCVLNSRTPLPMALNAMGHVLVGLMGRLDRGDTALLEYPFRSGIQTALISRYPIIILQARNANQLRTLAALAVQRGIVSNLFASTMLGKSAAEQQAQTAATEFEDAELLAVVLFGAAIEIDILTRKFSALKVLGSS